MFLAIVLAAAGGRPRRCDVVTVCAHMATIDQLSTARAGVGAPWRHRFVGRATGA